MARHDMFSWLLGKRKTASDGAPRETSPASSASPIAGPAEQAAAPTPINSSSPPLPASLADAASTPMSPVPLHGHLPASVAVSSPPMADAVTAELEPAPPAKAVEMVEKPTPAAGAGFSPSPSSSNAPPTTQRKPPASRAARTGTIVGGGSKPFVIAAGMPIVEQSGMAEREGIVVGVKADGRRVLAALDGSRRTRAYTRHADGIYRLDGSKGAHAPSLRLPN
ncbi:MAG: hypothetical protein NW205_11550 [Hyphomicrobiaceae bacterium]|nr:hypothetical protein [Hyphomicrobiaceae bacterium]